MDLHYKQELQVGLLVIVATAILIFGLIWLSGRSIGGGSVVTFDVTFTSIQGVSTGDPVQISGVRVGRVAKVEIEDVDQVVVMLEVRNKFRPRVDAVVEEDHPAHVGTFAYYSDNFALLKNVEAVDKHTVRFTLSRKYAPFLATMTLFSMGVVSPTAWASEGKDENGKYKYDFAHHPVGSGPFRFKEWKIDERIVLLANENHFMGRPHVDRLVFRPIKDPRARLKDLQANGVQAMDNPDLVDIAGAEADPDLTVLSQPGLNVCYMAMNTMKAPFDNVKVRQAIALAIHKRRLITAAYHGIGEPAATMCPKGIVGHLDIESRKPDIEAAKKLLAEAGFPDGFKTELWHGDVQRAYMPDPDSVAIQIQQDLKDIGVNATIKKMEWSAYIPATRRGEHSMCLLGWMADYGDPHNFLYVLMDKDNARVGSANNVSFYRGEAYSKLVHAAQEESDPKKRIALYEAAQRILHDESPTVPLVQIPDFRVVRKNVRGLYIYPVGGEYFRTVSFAKSSESGSEHSADLSLS